jgi:hypothetical protein
MKKYFLSYGKSTGDYNLDYGCFDRNREILGKTGGDVLIKKLRDTLSLHRKTIVYVQKDLESSLKDILLGTFGNSSVKFQFENKLESLC